MKSAIEFVLPLLSKASGTHDQAPLKVSSCYQLFHEESGHDCLPCTRVVSQKEPQWLTWQHRVIDRRDLVRQRVNYRGMNSQHWIEQMRELNAVSFRHETKGRAVSVKAPWSPRLDNL